MKSRVIVFFMAIIFALVSAAPASFGQSLKTPEEVFGFKPGTDRMLIDYEQLTSYLAELDEASPKLKMVEIGESPMGKKMYIAFISSAENIARLDELKAMNKRLALDPDIPEDALNTMVDDGKVFFLATLSMHSGEVGPSQAAPLIAYDLLTTSDPLKLKWMQDVVYMMVPNHNPDGMDMIVHHYRKYKGTKYEGSSLPRVYNKYIGHDNNRDFVILSQSDTKAIARIFNLDWFPQVMVEKHQMGSTGPRYFVPPMHDPIAENVDEGIWNWAGIFGMNMIKDMTKEGLAGISQHYIFDDYWPGSTETCIWKNVIGFLTECASAHTATPIYVEPNELRVGGKGLSEYKKSVNMPLPWKGGWWRLGDIVQYEITSTMSILKTSSLHRKDILKFRNAICRKEVNKGMNEAPYYYILPRNQHDESEFVSLVNLLKEQGVNVFSLTKDTELNGRIFRSGDVVVSFAQPFRAFIKEVMEPQEYPERHYTPGGELIRPYDITSWSLPLHRGVTSFQIDARSVELESALTEIKGEFTLKKSAPGEFKYALFSVNNNRSFMAAFTAAASGIDVKRMRMAAVINVESIPAGSFVMENSATLSTVLNKINFSPVYLEDEKDLNLADFNMPRIALVETYFHDMDAGWTRFVFDTYGIPFTVVHPNDFEKTDFISDFDVVVFPDENKDILMAGKRKRNGSYYAGTYPPEYVKGMGKKGMERLMSFFNEGGVIVSWGSSSQLVMGPLAIGAGEEKEEFQLPVRDISSGLSKNGFEFEGALARVKIIQGNPVTLGVPNEIGVFYRGRPVFQTSVPIFDLDRRVLGTFPEKDILLSGYAAKEKLAGNKSALVWLRKGKGQIVMFAFNPVFRSSVQASFKLLFNSLLLEKEE